MSLCPTESTFRHFMLARCSISGSFDFRTRWERLSKGAALGGYQRDSMNLRQIEVFHAVYLSGSISGAARLLNVSQPSVSKIVKHTQSRLGFPLFSLVKGRLVPTDEAHFLYRDVHDLWERVGTFQRTVENMRSQTNGCIKLGVLPSLALSIAPETVSKFRSVAPRVSIELSAIHHDSFWDALASRECDLVIGHDLLHEPELKRISLGYGTVGVLFRQDLLPNATDHVNLDALEDYHIINFAPSVAIGSLIGAATAGRNREIVVRSVYIAAALAREGVGMAVVDEFTARGVVGQDLRFLPLQPAVTFKLEALHMAAYPLSRQADQFLKVMRRVVSSHHVSDA